MKGFTLIEVLVAMSVAAVAGFLLIQILVRNNSLLFQQSAKINQGLVLNDVASEIGDDVKNASYVAMGYPTSAPSTFSSSTSLVLQIPAIDNSNNTIDNTYDYVVIQSDSAHPNVLLESTYPDPVSSRKKTVKPLLNNLSEIKFSYLDSSNSSVTPSAASRVSFVITLITNSGQNQLQSSASARFNLRNG